MNDSPPRTTPVSIHILDKEYQIACEEDEREKLRDAARFLNEQMRLMRDSGVIGNELIAVMVALNLANELLACKNEKADYTLRASEVLQRMQSKLDRAGAESGGSEQDMRHPAP